MTYYLTLVQDNEINQRHNRKIEPDANATSAGQEHINPCLAQGYMWGHISADCVLSYICAQGHARTKAQGRRGDSNPAPNQAQPEPSLCHKPALFNTQNTASKPTRSGHIPAMIQQHVETLITHPRMHEDPVYSHTAPILREYPVDRSLCSTSFVAPCACELGICSILTAPAFLVQAICLVQQCVR